MAKYVVELEGTVTLDAADEIAAEDMAMDLIHGDISTLMESNADIEFDVVNTKEFE